MNMDMLPAAVNSQDVKNGLDSRPPADSRRTLGLINDMKLQGRVVGWGGVGVGMGGQKRARSWGKADAQSTNSPNVIQ